MTTERELMAEIPRRARRVDWLGVHSIAEFVLEAPSLDDAEAFYGAFGLHTASSGTELLLRTATNEHVWGRVVAAPRKRLAQLTFHCFEGDLDPLHSRADALGADARHDGFGMWLRDPDGVLICVRPGPKMTLDHGEHRGTAIPVDGVASAPYRRKAAPILPQRLSHIVRLTPDVQAQVDFCIGVLGLRLSDRSGDGVAFLHGPHGSDHHLLAFAKSDGPALHHLSWDVPTMEDVALGMMRMQAAGFQEGWGVGRHVVGSNYFYYARDPWGSFCELSAQMDFIPAELEWPVTDHDPEDTVYLWGPPIPQGFLHNSERPAQSHQVSF